MSAELEDYEKVKNDIDDLVGETFEDMGIDEDDIDGLDEDEDHGQ